MKTKNIATQLCAQTKTHDEWLTVMRFGLKTLINDQPTLLDCVFTEARREKERADKPRNKQDVPAIAWEILCELELNITTDVD